MTVSYLTDDSDAVDADILVGPVLFNTFNVRCTADDVMYRCARVAPFVTECLAASFRKSRHSRWVIINEERAPTECRQREPQSGVRS